VELPVVVAIAVEVLVVDLVVLAVLLEDDEEVEVEFEVLFDAPVILGIDAEPVVDEGEELPEAEAEAELEPPVIEKRPL